MRHKIALSDDLIQFASIFKKAGYKCYFVGGAIRDSLLGFSASDWDAATDAKPNEIQKLFRTVIPTGIQHGTVTVKWHNLFIETTTFRLDGEYKDGRHPESITFTDDIECDLSRRDFTINGMALDPFSLEIIDPFDGKTDLNKKIIKAIGNPENRFFEDGLRTIRAVRFAARFGFSIDAETFDAIPLCLEKFKIVSEERKRDEFSKIILSSRPKEGIDLLYKSGLLNAFIPELVNCYGVAQGSFHKYTVFDHLAFCLKASNDLEVCSTSENKLVLRLACLFHDVEKPSCTKISAEKGICCYGHDFESAKTTEKILRRLKYPNDVIESVCHLIKNHMFYYEDTWTDGAVRRFVSRVGLDYLHELCLLRLCDTTAMGFGDAKIESVMPLITRVENFVKKNQAFTLKDMKINGNDLIALGVKNGKQIGKILNELLETVLEDANLNSHETLIEIAKKIIPKYGE